jgi:NADPH:quinone reductase-like Zn-dependent oxidoreductase
MSSMKAVRIHSYGNTDVLRYEDAPRPTAGPHEVLIRVYATSVNPFDCAVRAGYLSGFFNYTLPIILGTDVAGVVEAVGPGTTAFAPGDPVYARAGVFRDGANAEYVSVAATDVAAKPKTLDFIHSAAVPHVTLTAWQALIESANLSEGQTVLIHAAAGGVGHVAVQLAKVRGAKVLATASGNNHEFLRELGVDEVIDYNHVPFEDVVQNVDVVLDAVGGDTQQRSWSVLNPGGVLLSLVQPPSEEAAAARGARAAYISSAPPIGKVLGEVAEMIDSGRITPTVSAVLPLADIVKAHQMIETRHTRGKIVLQVVA